MMEEWAGDGHAASTINRSHLSDNVANHIRSRIMSGKLRSGDHLVVDRLAKDLGVSATPVREALMVLRSEGLCLHDPNKGYRVAPVSRQDIQDVYWLNATLAGQLAARAACAVDADSLRQLREVQDGLEAAALAQDYRSVTRLNDQFHGLINELAESPKLGWFLSLTLNYIPKGHHGNTSEWIHDSVQGHWDIIAALDSGDPELAREATGRHIIHAGEILSEYLDEISFWPAGD